MNVLLELSLLLLKDRTHVFTSPTEFDGALQGGRFVGVRDETETDGRLAFFDTGGFELIRVRALSMSVRLVATRKRPWLGWTDLPEPIALQVCGEPLRPRPILIDQTILVVRIHSVRGRRSVVAQGSGHAQGVEPFRTRM